MNGENSERTCGQLRKGDTLTNRESVNEKSNGLFNPCQTFTWLPACQFRAQFCREATGDLGCDKKVYHSRQESGCVNRKQIAEWIDAEIDEGCCCSRGPFVGLVKSPNQLDFFDTDTSWRVMRFSAKTFADFKIYEKKIDVLKPPQLNCKNNSRV